MDDSQPSRDRIADWAYANIRDAILEAELPPGARLSVPDLARRLSISRSPAREAVLRLLSEGLAVEVPHRGAFVASISVENLVDLYAVRCVLEGMAAGLAAGNIDPAGERAIQNALDAHRAAIDGGELRAITEADMEFHSLVYQMSGNPWLADSLMHLQGLVRLGMQTTVLVSGSPVQALSEHEQIFAAIVARKPDEAEERALSHVERLRATLQAQ